MDPYRNYIDGKKRRGVNRGILVVSVLLVLLIGLILGYLLHWGGFGVRMKLLGDPEITLRYGESYADPGAEAVFEGKHLFQNGKWLSVTREGEVDEEKVGIFEITYRAKFGIWSAETKRTVKIVDRVKPKILLYSDPGTYVIPGEAYVEEGFLARDNYDGDLNDRVQIRRYHNKIVYSVTDSSGNRTEVERKIVYYDPVYPDLCLEGETEILLRPGENYEEPGYAASDNLDGDLTDQVVVSGRVNSWQAGKYTITYTVVDRFGNVTTKTRIVKVQHINQPEIVEPEGKVIYLTFDDGPGPYTEELLEILEKYDVKATFFVVKTKYLDLLKDIAAQGHSIGIHSVSHDYEKIYASEEAYFQDLNELRSLIKKTCGVDTTLVRFPGGSSNTVSRFNKGIMTRLCQALTDMGYQYYDWNVNSGDAGLTRKTEEVVQYIKEGILKQDISIVLQHDIKEYSVAAVEEIILWGLENGYRFLPLDPTSPNAHHEIRN